MKQDDTPLMRWLRKFAQSWLKRWRGLPLKRRRTIFEVILLIAVTAITFGHGYYNDSNLAIPGAIIAGGLAVLFSRFFRWLGNW